MTRFFILLSGEHPTIPLAEIESIVASEGFEPKLLEIHDDVAILESEVELPSILQLRSSMTLAAGRLLFTCKPVESTIVKVAGGVLSETHGSRSASVRVRRFKGAHPELSRSWLEREIGEILASSSPGRIRIDLSHPDTTFLGVITSNSFILGELMITVDRGAYDKRRPRTRPFFKPGVLEPRIARVFVNLSRVNASRVFYDPFVGTGGFLVEACIVSRYALGSDADLRMVDGARRNLRHYNFANFDLILADAARMPIRSVECVGFDPPYGRATSTRKRETEALVLSSLEETSRILPGGGHIVVAFPSQLRIEEKLPPGSFHVVARHSMRVHRSLTRSILILRRSES